MTSAGGADPGARARDDVDLDALVAAIQRNCDLADAAHAQELSLCVYLLELREFFRWHRSLPLRVAPERAEVARWIAERERLWESLDDPNCEGFVRLPLDQATAPFEEERANEVLARRGLVYGAGMGRFGRHEFFLAEPIARTVRDGARVTVTGRELARTMSPSIGTSRGDRIVVRSDVLRRWLWTRVEQARRASAGDAFGRSLAAHGGDDASAVDAMVDAQVEATILHELGEARAGRLLGADWERMLATIAQRRTELVARAVRDLLADCLLTLPTLLERDDRPSLHFWFSNLEGMRRQIAPDLRGVYTRWAAGDETALAAAIDEGAAHWLRTARRLLDAWRGEGLQALDALSDELSGAVRGEARTG
ncbi:MAG: hypothetical protein KJZ83_08450 [Burkholderiaceae bacterium]|nr:hypothetical protein [Burkholderiaceae bacterium]